MRRNDALHSPVRSDRVVGKSRLHCPLSDDERPKAAGPQSNPARTQKTPPARASGAGNATQVLLKAEAEPSECLVAVETERARLRAR